MTDTSIGTSN